MKFKHGISGRIEGYVASQLQMSEVSKVVAGVSGGADSTALLLALRSCGADLIAVHCNFHLRGDESMRDQRFVEEQCYRLGVALSVVDFDVEDYMESRGVSVEMACRELRYSEFRKIMDISGASRISVAHNADDNIETMMLNLFRGSGVKGLRGMLPDNGEIIRPLLSFNRKEIEQYLAEKGEEFVVDSTNLQSDYRRNFLRNEVLPLLESRWPGVRKAITKSICNLRVEDKIIQWVGESCVPEGDFLSLQQIAEAPDAYWIIYKFASAHGATRDISLEIYDVYRKKAGSQTIVGKKWKSGDGILIFTMKGLKYEGNADEIPIPLS